MSQPKVLAIILNWKQPEMTLECVQALKSMNPPISEILVIDNGSGDNSADILQNSLPSNSLKLLPHNLGFAGGMNVGLTFAQEHQFDFALLINNDAFPAPDMLKNLLNEIKPDIGLLSPMIFYAEEPQKIWFAGGRRHPTLLELRGRGMGRTLSPKLNHSKDVDYLLGTCLFVDLSAVQKVGLLDDSFFMYYEDLDWSIRFQQQKYRLRLVANAHLYHRVAVSSGGTDSPIRRYYLARSSILFFHRYAHLGRPILILLYRIGSALKMLARLTLKGQFTSASAYLRGLWDGLRQVKQQLQ